jgi:hypothetical protein
MRWNNVESIKIKKTSFEHFPLSFHLSQGGIEIEHNRHYTSGEV